MKNKFSFLPLFFGFLPSVLLAQNVTNAQAPHSAPAVENFPSRAAVQSSWEQSQPPSEPSAVLRGPSTSMGSDPTSSTRVAGRSLPDPKIDYSKEAIDRVSPMTPEEIRRFEAALFERARAMAQTPGGPYTLKGNRVMRISFEPNARPETIDVAMNLGALVMFVDRNGNPLTIEGAKSFSFTFDVGMLQTEEAKTKGSATVEILPKALVGHGNMMIRLAGVVNPILLQVKIGDSKLVDSVVQVVVPVNTPSRDVLPGDRMAGDGGTLVGEMQGFLMGIAPEDAVDVPVRQVGSTSAWMWRNHLYVRTPHTIFSPGWFRRQGAVDGTAVYELPLTSVIRMGVEGREMDAIFELPYIPPTLGVKK